MEIIDPRGARDVIEWTDRMYPLLEEIATPSQLEDAADWREWAAQLLTFDAVATWNAPDPYIFDDWRDWADRFNQSVGGA